jgi:hypothetical protein
MPTKIVSNTTRLRLRRDGYYLRIVNYQVGPLGLGANSLTAKACQPIDVCVRGTGYPIPQMRDAQLVILRILGWPFWIRITRTDDA